MSRVSYAGGCAALGVLAIALAGCAAAVQPGGPPDGLQTHETPPIASCPDTRLSRLPDVSGSALVPDTPTLAFACRYAGLNDPHPNALVQAAQVGGARLTTLVATLNAAGPWPPGRYCPIDLGLYDLIVFVYPSGNESDVQVTVTGCPSASNGHKTVQAGADLLGQLTSMVGASPPPSS